MFPISASSLGGGLLPHDDLFPLMHSMLCLLSSPYPLDGGRRSDGALGFEQWMEGQGQLGLKG